MSRKRTIPPLPRHADPEKIKGRKAKAVVRLASRGMASQTKH